METITQEHLFDHNVKEIIKKFREEIDTDTRNEQTLKNYMMEHSKELGMVFFEYLIDYYADDFEDVADCY